MTNTIKLFSYFTQKFFTLFSLIFSTCLLFLDKVHTCAHSYFYHKRFTIFNTKLWLRTNTIKLFSYFTLKFNTLFSVLLHFAYYSSIRSIHALLATTTKNDLLSETLSGGSEQILSNYLAISHLSSTHYLAFCSI